MTESSSESVSLKFLWSLLLEGSGDREPWACVSNLIWAPDGSYMIISGYQEDQDTEMGPGDSWDIVWRVSLDGKWPWGVRNRGDGIAFSRDGKHLIMADPLTLNDPATGQLLKEVDAGDPEFSSWFNRGNVYKASESRYDIELHKPDGNKELIYSGSDKIITALTSQDNANITLICFKTIACLDLPDGSQRWCIDYNSKYKPYLADNRELIVLLKDAGEDISLIERETGKICQTISGHDKCVTAAAFFPDNRRLITGSADHTLRIWNIETAAELARIELENKNEAREFVFSPDATKVAVVCWQIEGRYNYSLKLFDLIQAV